MHFNADHITYCITFIDFLLSFQFQHFFSDVLSTATSVSHRFVMQILESYYTHYRVRNSRTIPKPLTQHISNVTLYAKRGLIFCVSITLHPYILRFAALKKSRRIYQIGLALQNNIKQTANQIVIYHYRSIENILFKSSISCSNYHYV